MKAEKLYDVVISGIGGYFPKANNIEELKKVLLNNENLLDTRWKAGEKGVTNVIGKILNTQFFDASYFGIHRDQSAFMDPMQRLALESTYAALIDAGVNPLDIKGQKIPVFSGSTSGENDNVFYESIVNGFGLTGHARTMISNRISYWLNINGPSYTCDSNWLNGIDILSSAYDGIKFGHFESAIVVTVNLALHSEWSWTYNDIGLISPDGATRSFDADANGYGRSDGVIVLYVQRACQAKRAYATILGVKSRYINSPSNSKDILRPINVDNMTDFIRDFYDECKIDPKNIDFVECYGCGHKNVDQDELAAIDRVYCKDRTTPLLVGSVKSNTGHAEASSVFMSIAKALIVMETGTIPANLGYNNPNPDIPSLIDGRIQVVSKNTEWNGDLIAINAIGISSVYGHVLLKVNPKRKIPETDGIPRLITMCSRTEEGIEKALSTIKSDFMNSLENISLIQDIFKKSIPAHMYRGYTILDETEKQISEFGYNSGDKRNIWFVYSGMGSQWCKMGADLMKLSVFAATIHKCHKILEPKGINLINIITEDDEKMFDNILNAFVGIAAIQIGLTDIMRALGVVPDGIIGHSVGELGCAYADGCFTVEQTILSAYSRGKASLEAELIEGMMAAVGKGYNQIKDECPPSIAIACHNGPDSCTLSGPTKDMNAFVEKLKKQNIFARLVNVSNIAYHSQYIKPAGPLLLKYLKEVILEPMPRSSKWISTSIPEKDWNADLAKTSSAEYHTNNLLSSVLFEEGLKHIPKNSILIEIAPHGLLQAILKRSLKIPCTNISLTNKSSNDGLQFLLNALGKMYLGGVDLNISILYPQIEYPVSRGIKSLTPLIYFDHEDEWIIGQKDKFSYFNGIKNVNISVQHEECKYLVGNQLQESIVIPTSAYLSILFNVLVEMHFSKVTAVIFENIKFQNIITLPKIGSVPIFAMIQKGNGNFEISSQNHLIATGTIRIQEPENTFVDVPKIDFTQNLMKLTHNDIYTEFCHRGHKYSGRYKTIREILLSNQASVSTVHWNNDFFVYIDSMLQQLLFRQGECNQDTLTISSIQSLVVSIPDLPKEAADVELSYDYFTGIIATKGIQISGVTAKPLILEQKLLSYSSLELTSLTNMSYKCIENGINFGLQLVINNFHNQNVKSLAIIEIETENPILQEDAENVAETYAQLNINTSLVKDAKTILVPPNEPLLVIMNNTLTDPCVKFLTSTPAFLLVQTSKAILSYPEVVQVAQFSVNDVSYSILKKKVDDVPTIVHAKVDTLTSNDLYRENLSWVSQLKSAINTSRTKIYLVTSVVPSEGVPNFARNVLATLGVENLRFVFILDKNAPEFTLEEITYQNIFKQDLLLTVIKVDFIGCYISLNLKYKDDVSNIPPSTNNVIDNTRVDYLGINVLDHTLTFDEQPKAELGHLDYSGVTSSGQRVMGLARFDKKCFKLVFDPILRWEVPEKWSLENAATVPQAYITAYYALIQVGKLKTSDTVLIHHGCSAIGLAAISIASIVGATIFTTVTSDKQRPYLKKQFQFLLNRNILSARNVSFEPHILMTTGGQGAQVILNCLTGSMRSATIRCLSKFGRMIQLGNADVNANNDIGMSIFLKNLSVYNVTPESICNVPVNIKKNIHRFLSEGLNNFAVRPLENELVDHQDIETILKTLKDPEKIGKTIVKLSDNLELCQLNVNKSLQFICDAKSSYLIYGGTAELWCDVLEWLIIRGARRVVISSDEKPQQIHLQRRITLLQTYFNAEIIFTSNRAHTRSAASELLSEVYLLGPIGIVFLLPAKTSTMKNSEVMAVRYMETVLKNTAPKALLINFLSTIAGICQLRMDLGFPTHNIAWDKTLEFSDILQTLDNILRIKLKNVCITTAKVENVDVEDSYSLYEKLNLIFPISIDDLKEETSIAPITADFLQFSSLSTRAIQEAPPFFVFPGMFSRRTVRNFAFKLLSPVFCANYPNTYLPVQEIADKLTTKMKEIYPKGPYNIVGISYGGIIALEVAKKLEQNNCMFQMYLVDGAPETIQNIFKLLSGNLSSEVGFLRNMLTLTDFDIIKHMNTLSNWESRLRYGLKQYNYSEEDQEYLRQTLTLFKKHIDDILSYRPSVNLTTGRIKLLRPSGSNKHDNCGLENYCKQNVDVFVVNGNHLSMLEGTDTIQVVNSNMFVR